MTKTEKQKLEELARTGPRVPADCCECGTPTRSHVMINYGNGWIELPEDDPWGRIEVGVRVKMAVICHTCFVDIEDDWEPDKDDWGGE